jgi:PAS domain S-box-containing protein
VTAIAVVRVAKQIAPDSISRDERDRLVAMLDCAPAFIIAVNRKGTIEFINRTLPQYRKADVIGLHWLAFFPPNQQALMESKLAAMYATESTQIYEVSTAGPDGVLRTFDTQIAPLHHEGEIVGGILVSQDVTERKRTQAELLANRHMALLGTLAAGVAHEINTPIQFVRDNIQFLSEGARDLLALVDRHKQVIGADEDSADLPYLQSHFPSAFAGCIDGLNKIARIVRSLKDFAHPSEEHKMAADLNRIVENALTIATNEYKFVADVQTDFADLPPVSCHAAEIGQVVLNIVVNAAHAIEDVMKEIGRRGTIKVTTRVDGDAAVIRIQDTGKGIPEAIRSRIFDPFFTTKVVGKGTGQGLAIACSMVRDRHDGELTFETEVGHGTTFVVRLPIAQPNK